MNRYELQALETAIEQLERALTDGLPEPTAQRVADALFHLTWLYGVNT